MTSPGGVINSIAIHPTNPNLLAVASNSSNKVFVSSDGGGEWVNYLFNLPGFSALSVVWDDNGEDGLYLGMNYGLLQLWKEGKWDDYDSFFLITNDTKFPKKQKTIKFGQRRSQRPQIRTELTIHCYDDLPLLDQVYNAEDTKDDIYKKYNY